MAEGARFDDFTRALAGGGGRRGFLRLLGGGLAGALAGALLPRDGEAAPAAQATCSPRPRVNVTTAPGFERLSVTVGATGQGNAVQRVQFGTLRNAVIDVPGVASGVGNGFAYTPPPGATQTGFTVRALDGAQAVHAPFTVTDGCGAWPTFVGAGAGTLRNQAIVCPSGETTLTAPAPVGTSTLQVANQVCFKVGDRITLGQGTPNEETLQVAGFGSVVTATATTRAHAAGTPILRRPATGETCQLGRLIDPCASTGDSCCDKPGTPAGVCCPFGQCCDPYGIGKSCLDASFFKANDLHCGRCNNPCSIGFGERCIDGECKCPAGPSGLMGRSIRGVCCAPPNQACGPANNQQCCMNSTHYCSQPPGSPHSVCCPKAYAACGITCCSNTWQYCDNGHCTGCPCGADRYDSQSNQCRCGTGPPCDQSQAMVCENGACVCYARPGHKIGAYQCRFDQAARMWFSEAFECPSDGTQGQPFWTICRASNGSLYCQGGVSRACIQGDAIVEPLCETPA